MGSKVREVESVWVTREGITVEMDSADSDCLATISDPGGKATDGKRKDVLKEQSGVTWPKCRPCVGKTH